MLGIAAGADSIAVEAAPLPSQLNEAAVADGLAQPRNPAIQAEFEAWKRAAFAGIVPQKYSASCGAASLATLLTYFYGLSTSEDELLAAAGLSGEAPLSMLDLKRMAKSKNVQLSGRLLDLDAMRALKRPVIVRIDPQPRASLADDAQRGTAGANTGSRSHFIVVAARSDGRIDVKDPSAGNSTMESREFLERWSQRGSTGKGVVLLVSDRESVVSTADASPVPSQPEKSLEH